VQVIATPAFQNRSENPYNWLLYTAIGDLGVDVIESSPQTLFRHRSDIWHLHWPEGFLNDDNPLKVWAKLFLLIGLVSWTKWRGTKLIWTVHNLQAHERRHPQLERWFWQYLTPRLDGYISLSQAGREAAQTSFPALHAKPGFVVPHSHYRAEYPPRSSSTPAGSLQLQARAKLGFAADATVILFFGRIRAYKNVEHLIQVFRQITHPQAILALAGRPEPAAAKIALERLIADDDRIQAHFDFVPHIDTPTYFQAADLVVLPYREILNSGSALLALSLDCPVLVPARGAMGELQDFVGDAWVKTYPGDLTAADLQAAIDWATTYPREPTAPLDALDTQTIAQQTIAAYAQVLQSTAPKSTHNPSTHHKSPN
jgi:beta-1,4-mannosyltransferase